MNLVVLVASIVAVLAAGWAVALRLRVTWLRHEVAEERMRCAALAGQLTRANGQIGIGNTRYHQFAVAVSAAPVAWSPS